MEERGCWGKGEEKIPILDAENPATPLTKPHTAAGREHFGGTDVRSSFVAFESYVYSGLVSTPRVRCKPLSEIWNVHKLEGVRSIAPQLKFCTQPFGALGNGH